jgi:predicted TIM-barrel fold metal-dependent hydrolase
MCGMPSRRCFLGLCCAGPFVTIAAPAHGAGEECLRPLPAHLTEHELVAAAWEGLDPSRVWDAHAHLVGTGDSGSGAYVDPRTESWLSPVERVRRIVLMNAACVHDAQAPGVDRGYLERLLVLLRAFPPGVKMVLLAFDHAVDEEGRERADHSTFHTPDEYAAAVAAGLPQRFEWIASVHPYREDALARLDRAVAAGARGVKWLPSAMNIDPASKRCDAFYQRLVRWNLPLVVHCGEEVAAPGARRESFNNPLRVRRALDHGVRVIVAHAASLGRARDLDAGGDAGPWVAAFDLLARLMQDRRYERLLFADLSAVFQRNRDIEVQRRVLTWRHGHARLLHGSDYPLPGIAFIYRIERFVDAGWLTAAQAGVLRQIRPHNPLLFEFLLKRMLAADGARLDAAAFHTRDVLSVAG